MTYSFICVIYPATESEFWEPFDASTRCSLGLQLLHCMAILKVHEVSKIQRLSLSPARVKLPWYSLMFGHLANFLVSRDFMFNHCNWCFPCMWFRHRIIQLDLIIDRPQSKSGGRKSSNSSEKFDRFIIQIQFLSASWDHHQGSLNVPIEHHPTIRYMVYNGYYKVMSNIPKMGHLPTPDHPKGRIGIWKNATILIHKYYSTLQYHLESGRITQSFLQNRQLARWIKFCVFMKPSPAAWRVCHESSESPGQSGLHWKLCCFLICYDMLRSILPDLALIGVSCWIQGVNWSQLSNFEQKNYCTQPGKLHSWFYHIFYHRLQNKSKKDVPSDFASGSCSSCPIGSPLKLQATCDNFLHDPRWPGFATKNMVTFHHVKELT